METTETTTQEVVVDGMDRFFDNLTQAATTVSEKLIEVTPAVAEALLSLVQYKGMFTLTTAFILLIIAGLIIRLSLLRIYRAIVKTDEDPFLYVMLFILLCCFTIMLLMVSVASIGSFYNWVAVFYPEGAIALKALEAAGIDI